MDLREINDKFEVISKEVINLLIHFVSTIINNKNTVNETLDFKDLDIILSSGEGRKKIFSSLSIINQKFDPKTFSKNNIPKFLELQDIVSLFDEEGIKPEDIFEKIKFDLVPKLKEGIKFELSFCDFLIFEQFKKEEIFDKNFFKENNTDNRSIFCIYCKKLDGKKHKLQKIVDFIDKIGENKDFFNKFKKILIIFEVKSKGQMGDEYNDNIPYDIKDVNENENYKNKFSILFNIKKDDNSPSEIFNVNKDNKLFYFILDNNNYVRKLKNFYGYDSVIDNLNDEKILDEQITNEQDKYKEKVDLFYKFYTFLKDVKKLKYNFSLKYDLDLILTYDNIKEKLFIKDIVFNRFSGQVLPQEYKILKPIVDIFKPSNEEFKEIECKDIDIDFDDMTCIKCGEDIKPNEELFYCYECKEKYCYNCVKDHLLNNEGKDKFIDPKHNLIFFKTRNKENLKNIEVYKLGKNLFANTDENNLDRFKYAQCNGCANKFANSARYICLSCTPGIRASEGYNDYCQNCIEHMMKEDKTGENIQKRRDNVYSRDFYLLSDESCYMSHDHKNHIYLMVPLSCEDQENAYYDY